MKTLIIATLIALTATSGPTRYYGHYSDMGMYNVWEESGLHLMMCDNGTPDDYDDDWVVDWETNREVVVWVLDK